MNQEYEYNTIYRSPLRALMRRVLVVHTVMTVLEYGVLSTPRKVGKYHQRGITYEASKGVHVESMTTVKFRGV